MAKSLLYTVNFGSSKTGLSTVGYTLYQVNGTVHTARTTSGVVEFGTSGVYGAIISRPDEDVLVLWDTGEGTPRYGSEDSRVLIDGIASESDKIKLIWNSLKNQGEFIAVLMDKFGLLEKNIGLIKPFDESSVKKIVVDAVSKIKIPEPKEIKIPDFPKINTPNYENNFRQIDSKILELSKKIDTIKPEKADFGVVVSQINNKSDEIKKIISDIKIPEQKDMSQNFKNIETYLSESAKNINSEVGAKLTDIKIEMSKFMLAFNKLDSIISRINDLKDISKSSEYSAKERQAAIKEETARIIAEMKEFNKIYSNQIANSSTMKDMLMLVGHRIK